MRTLRDVKVTPKAAEKIRRLRLEGMTVPDLSKRFGISKTLVYVVLCEERPR